MKYSRQLNSLSTLGVFTTAIVVLGVSSTRAPSTSQTPIKNPFVSVRGMKTLLEEVEKTGVEPDFYEAYLRFLEQRAGPDGTIDWGEYEKAIAFIDRMPAATLRTDYQPGTQNPPGNGVQWEFIGPRNYDVPFKQFFGPSRSTSGRVNAIAINPKDPRVIFVASPGGGVLKSTDRGFNWTAVADNVVDGGNVWKGLQVSSLAINPDNPQIVFAGTGDSRGFYRHYGFGMLRSTDGGATWRRNWVPPGSPAITTILIDPDRPATMIALTGGNLSRGGDAYLSTDGGDTFNSIGGLPSGDWSDGSIGAKDAMGKRKIWVCGFRTNGAPRVYYSDDHGATWNNRTPGAVSSRATALDFCYAALSIAASPVSPNKVFLLSGQDRAIFRTINSGTGWDNVTNNLPPGPNVPDCFRNPANPQPMNWNQSGYDYRIRCSYVPGTNVSIVYVSLLTLCGSTDDGATWSDITKTFENPPAGGPPPLANRGPTQAEDANAPATSHNDAHCLEFNPLNPNEVMFGNDGGMYRMTYNSVTRRWSTPTVSLNAALPISQFYTLATHFTYGDRVMGGTQDNATPRSWGANSPIDNLAPDLDRWNNAAGGDGGACLISPLDQNVQFATSNGTIFKTTDAWSQTILPQSWTNPAPPATPTPNYGNTEPMLWPTNLDPASFLSAITGDFIAFDIYGATANHVFRYRSGGAKDARGVFWINNGLAGGNIRYRLGPAGANYNASGQRFGTADGPTGRNAGQITAILVAPGDPDRLYVACSNGELWMSTNPRVGVTDVRFTLISQGRNAANSIPVNSFITSIAVHPFDQNIVYVGIGGTANGHLRACSDVTRPQAEREWRDMDGGRLPNVSLNAVAVDTQDPIRHIYVGTDYGVFYTSDNGATWNDLNRNRSLPYVQVNALATRCGTGFLTAATFGRGIWRIPIGNAFIAAMGVTPAPMRGRTTSLCRVYLCGYANGRQTLQVASSDPRVVVPATFQIGNGQIVGDFQVRAGAIAATTYVTITVTLAGESKSQIVRIDP